MESQVTLVCDLKNAPPLELLFEKVAGIPLLLRNLLALHKAKFQKIALVLPAILAERYYETIAPVLEKRGIHIFLSTYDKEASEVKMVSNIKIPAHALVETKIPSPFYKLIVDDAQKIGAAEKILTEAIRLSTLGPIAKHLNKRISLPISLWLTRLDIHPNWITLINMTLGMSTGLIVARGNYLSYVVAGFLFQCASIFDGCDGEVAKLSFNTSKFGQYFDTLSDNGALISFFIGLLFAHAKFHSASFTLGVAALLLVGLGGLLWQMIAFLKKHTQSASLATFDKEYLAKLPPSPLTNFIRSGKIFMRKDCFSLLIFVLALLGALPWWLYFSIGATWISNGVLLIVKQQPLPFSKITQTYE